MKLDKHKDELWNKCKVSTIYIITRDPCITRDPYKYYIHYTFDFTAHKLYMIIFVFFILQS